MSTDEYVPDEFMVRGAYNYARGAGPDSDAALDAEFDRFLARVRRDAKAEALREMQEHHEREADKAQTITARGIHLTIADGARKRATEYETGDSDEHQ